MKRSKGVRLYRTLTDRIVMACVWFLLLLITAVVLVPILFIIASSFSGIGPVKRGEVFIWPVDFTLDSYRLVFATKGIMKGFTNSVAYTGVGTLVSVAMTLLAGYPLSRTDLKIRQPVIILFTITMFFGGGLIPTYLLVNKLKLLNTFWAMIIPNAMGVWNCILVKTYIQSSIPGEIFESATIDGCSDWNYFIKMVLPLSKAIIAVLVLMYAVGKWNDYFSGLIYMSDPNKYPLQLVLRQYLILKQDVDAVNLAEQLQAEERKQLLQYALIVVSSLPVMVLYPFVQKHFVKGVMLGSIKG